MHLLTSKFKLYLYLFFFIFLTSVFNFKILDNYKEIFSIKKIEIYGLSNNKKKKIEHQLDNLKRFNILSLKEDAILKTLDKLNYIEQIYVNKILPSTINIKLLKTAIIGQTLVNGEMFFIGENGKLINPNQFNKNKNIPIVFGDFKIEDYKYLQNILTKHHVDISKIEKYYFYKNKRWDILFSNGLTLKLPSQNAEKSINIYNKLLHNNNLKNIKIVDLRVFDQIILTDFNE